MATPSTSTATLLRQSLSDALGLPADQVPLEANLIEWGLDSVTLIRLAGQWRRQGLAARFADRPQSKSRIDRAVNRFTTVA